MKIVQLIVIVLAIVLITSTSAADDALNRGISWLKSVQNPDGSWGSGLNSLYTTTEVLDLFGSIGETSPSVANGLTFLSQQSPTSSDLLARTIRALATHGGSTVPAVAQLLALRQPDSGWGLDGEGTSTSLDTAIVLQALASDSFSDLQLMGQSLTLLTSSQSVDGGWGYAFDEESIVHATALVVLALSRYTTLFDMRSPINQAVPFLTGFQNSDGGFGQQGSTIVETALALEALLSAGADLATIAPSALTFLRVAQQPNGSWNDDPTLTALALRALTSDQPNLSVAEISFSNPLPIAGDQLRIQATVRNKGLKAAEQVVVAFFQGNPDTGGVLLGTVTLSTVGAGSTALASIDVTLSQAGGSQTFFVRLDPSNTIPEITETDNQTSLSLTAASLPDLTLTGADIVADPAQPAPNAPVTLRFTLHNRGESASSGTLVRIFDGTPEQGLFLADLPLPTLSGGRSITLELISVFPQGTHQMTALLDPHNAVIESNEGNNRAFVFFNVTSGATEGVVDLAVSPDLRFDPMLPIPGQPLTITSFVSYMGDLTVSTTVSYFLGNPDQSGVLLESVPVLLWRGLTVNTSTTLTVPTSGTAVIFVVVDAPNIIQELDETNNRASRLILTDLPELTLKSSDITFIPELSAPGATITITALIHNLGTQSATAAINFYHGNPESGGTLIGTSTVTVPAMGTTLASINWVRAAGTPTIFVVIDPTHQITEADETNNSASRTIGGLFTDVTAMSGLSGDFGQARGLADTDGDGDLDLVVAGLNSGVTKFYENRGDGTFIDITPQTTITNSRDYGVAFGDIDNDGDLDLFIADSTFGNNRLYRNDGGNRFTDITIMSGLSVVNYYLNNPVFGDLNHDGHLDLVLSGFVGPSRVFLNNGNGTFTEKLNTIGEPSLNENVELGDIDGDGDLDLILVHSSALIYVYLNDGTGAFTLKTTLPGGFFDAALGDIDNDGDLDIVTRSVIYLNDGLGNFSTGHTLSIPPIGTLGISLADFDHDGDLDILAMNFTTYLRNNGDGTFTNITNSLNISFSGFSAVVGDIDGDGDLDLIGQNVIYRNNLNDVNYLKVQLRGFVSNRFGVGAKIFVYDEGHLDDRQHLRGFREVQGGGQSYISFDSLEAEFGLDHTFLYDLQVRFPGGIVANRHAISVGRTLLLPEFGDIALVNNDFLIDPVNPVAGQPVLLSLILRNPTAVDMEQVPVKIFNGDPQTGGLLLFQTVVDHITAEGSQAVTFEASFSAGSFQLFALVNPDRTVREQDFTNNLAIQVLIVGGVTAGINLIITGEVLTVEPVSPSEGSFVTIRGVVTNLGTLPSSPVTAAFYLGNPASGGIQLGEVLLPSLNPGEVVPVSLVWDTTGHLGHHFLYLIIDPNQTLGELREDDNLAFISLEVTQPTLPDLSIAQLTMTPTVIPEGTLVTLSALIENRGIATDRIGVQFYDGDPDAGGLPIDSEQIIIPILPLGGQITVEMLWDTAGQGGSHEIFVRVDPAQEIPESNETNNTRSLPLIVIPFGVMLQIASDQSTYGAQATVPIRVTAENLLSVDREVILDVLVTDTSGSLITSLLSPTSLILTPQSVTLIETTWNIGTTFAGEYKLTARIRDTEGRIALTRSLMLTILSLKSLQVTLVTDQQSYTANDLVSMTVTLTSQGSNTMLTNLVSTLTLKDPLGTTLLTESRSLPSLFPNARLAIPFTTTTGANRPGLYTVTLTVNEMTSPLANQTATFAILSSRFSPGAFVTALTATPQKPSLGETIIFTSTIRYQGNEEIPDLELTTQVVNAKTNAIVKSIPATVALLIGGTVSLTQILTTSDLAAGDYLLVLTGDLGGTPTTLASTSMTVPEPLPLVDAGSDQLVAEGDVVSFSGRLIGGSLEGLTITWDLGDSTIASGTLTPTHRYLDNGTFTVTLAVRNAAGKEASDTLTISVHNVSPAVDVGADRVVNEGALVTFQATITDPGTRDTHTAQWDFGDGKSGAGLSVSHVYADNGRYKVTVIVTDND
ncbi:MAG: VCBS repeat-containing protein, partial [Candidatus Tectomicrobia bacterium]|nr:VCBS repeat-containing protein [Candidatus Tectomicrobia bacterium]